jgi:hypothetical protein
MMTEDNALKPIIDSDAVRPPPTMEPKSKPGVKIDGIYNTLVRHRDTFSGT